jgi:hypothetical protein
VQAVRFTETSVTIYQSTLRDIVKETEMLQDTLQQKLICTNYDSLFLQLFAPSVHFTLYEKILLKKASKLKQTLLFRIIIKYIYPNLML